MQARISLGRWDDWPMDSASQPAVRVHRARRLWILVPAVVFVGLLAWAVSRTGGAPDIGDEAPPFRAELLAGDGSLSLGDLRGKPVLLNFWASWCGPCVDEAPMLRRAHEEFGDRVHFVGVDIRDARSDADDFVERHGLDYTHVRDERLVIYDDYGLTGQPETFLIDAEGRIAQHISGPFLSAEDLMGLLENVTRDG
jgi:cytochrome c biogenesis protein CcmG, thiol:disulfide interchange protein DsbE